MTRALQFQHRSSHSSTAGHVQHMFGEVRCEVCVVRLTCVCRVRRATAHSVCVQAVHNCTHADLLWLLKRHE